MSIHRFAALAALLAALAAAPALAAGEYSGATELGKPDLSLVCPQGSKWSPAEGGVCRGCPGGKTPKLGKCPRTVPGATSTAEYSHKRKRWSPICRVGTFKKPKSRDCYKCPKGYIHNPFVKFNRKGICAKPPGVAMDEPSIVTRVSIKEALNTKTIVEGVRTFGCNGYGKDAFLSASGFGSCWTCPKTHPIRTLYPAESAKACASNACGGEGERPCYLWERVQACDSGLRQNPFKKQCVARVNALCKPLLFSLARTREAVNKANEIGQGLKGQAMDKIPGMRAMMGFIDNRTEEMEEAMADLIGRLPTDALLADVDKLFDSPERVEAIAAVLVALGRHQDELIDLMLNPDIACDSESTVLADRIAEIINEAAPGDRGAVEPEVDFAALLGGLLASPAQAATPPPRRANNSRFASFGFAISSAATVMVKKGPAQLPVTFGVELAVTIGNDGVIRPRFYFIGGFDVPGKAEIGEFGRVGSYGSVLLPQKKSCPPIGGQIETANFLGVSFNCAGIAAVNFKLQNQLWQKIPEFFTSKGVRGIVQAKTSAPTRTGGRWKLEEDKFADPKWQLISSFGGNGGLLLIGSDVDNRAALAP